MPLRMISALLLLLSCFIPTIPAQAQDKLVIGVQDLNSEFNALTSSGVSASIVRATVLPGLTELDSREGFPPFRLRLANSFKTSTDLSKWSFRIGKTLFSSGATVSGADVAYSLKLCPTLKGLGELQIQETDQADRLGSWLELGSENNRAIKELGSLLSACPIIPQDISTLFGSLFGSGTNLVGAGNYIVNSADFKRRHLVLKRIYLSKENSVSGHWPEQIDLKNYEDGKAGLTALRLGSLDLFFTTDMDVNELARSDQTLVQNYCYGNKVWQRRSLSLSCKPGIDFARLHYVE